METIALGFDIGGTRVRVGLVESRRMLHSQSAVWPAAAAPHAEVAWIADLARQTIAQAGITLGSIRGAGVALAALTDRDGLVVRWPNRPAWEGLAFRSLLAADLALPVVVEDDANAATLAEWRYGSGAGAQHMLLITVGTGIGSGLVLSGRLFRGRHGWAGEIGHTTVDPQGPRCSCGRHGCLQGVAAGRRLEQIAAERKLSGVDQLSAAAYAGHDWAISAIEASGRWIGLAAANAANLLDLEVVVVGGGLLALGDLWWRSLAQSFEANLLYGGADRAVVRQAALPDTAGVLGAAALVEELV